MFKRQKIGDIEDVGRDVVFKELEKDAANGDWIGMITESEMARIEMADLENGKVEYYDVGGYRYTYVAD